MTPEEVVTCDAFNILDGLCLNPCELGRGTYGVVVSGSYQGWPCAIKMMLSNGLERAAVRELLLTPGLVHPNVVSTYVTRCAYVTHAFFDLLEGDDRRQPVHDSSLPRVLEPIPIHSEDGFGDPAGMKDGRDPLIVLHQILHSLRAETGQVLVVAVQEFCDIGTLANAIRKQAFKPNSFFCERVSRRAMLRTAAEVARGLLHLHNAGVVHGDLKPANVLLKSSREDRRGFTAKVADFGLAHILPQAATSMHTDSWGSVAYMAPEAFGGKVSLATDVWSFGVCLWQMLTGEAPYGHTPHAAVVAGVQSGLLLLQWPEDAPMAEPIVALGRRCLSHDPSERPTFQAIVADLVGIERGIRAELLAPRQRQKAAGQDTVTGMLVL